MPPMYSAVGFFGQVSPKADRKQKLSRKCHQQGTQPSGLPSSKAVSPPKDDNVSDLLFGKAISLPKCVYTESAALFAYARTLKREGAGLESENFGPSPDDPTDFMGRLLEVGDVVEALRALYQNQGDQLAVSSGWCGVIVEIDDGGDVVVAFGEGLSEKWIRRKDLGTLKMLEDEGLEHLEHNCTAPESNDSILA